MKVVYFNVKRLTTASQESHVEICSSHPLQVISFYWTWHFADEVSKNPVRAKRSGHLLKVDLRSRDLIPFEASFIFNIFQKTIRANTDLPTARQLTHILGAALFAVKRLRPASRGKKSLHQTPS